mgnify:CR=1 FL=1
MRFYNITVVTENNPFNVEELNTDFSYCDWYETLKLYPAGLNEPWEMVMERVIKDIKF